MLVDESAFPVDAAVEELRRALDGAAHLIAAVRRADRVGMARRTPVARPDAVAGQLRGLDHEMRPAREGLAGIVVVEMHVHREVRVQAAGERIGGGAEPQVVDALVLGGVRVALLHDVIAPGEVAV